MNEVTQADRDAVADYFESIDDDGSTYGAYRRGQEDNHPIVQSYAAHRIAAEKKTERRIVEWLKAKAKETLADKRELRDILKPVEWEKLTSSEMVYRFAAMAIERGDHKETKNG